MGVECVAVGRREMRPLLLKVGVALFLSFAGFLYGHLRSRGDHPRRGRHPHNASGMEEGREAGGGFKEAFPHGQSEGAPSIVSYSASGTVKGVPSSTSGMSPCSIWGRSRSLIWWIVSKTFARRKNEFSRVALTLATNIRQKSKHPHMPDVYRSGHPSKLQKSKYCRG